MELLGVFILAFVQTIWLSSTVANPIISIPMINVMAANITAVNATNTTTDNAFQCVINLSHTAAENIPEVCLNLETYMGR